MPALSQVLLQAKIWKNEPNSFGSFYSCLVRTTGLEPAWTSAHKNLNLARLPIPPCPQISVDFYTERISEGGRNLWRMRRIAKASISILAYRRFNVNLLAENENTE